MPAPQLMGIYPPDSITDVAQSLPIDPLGPGAAALLAGDVEYRLHLILQEAKKFMVHAKRTVLMPEDVEYAMEALNVEPILIPPRPLAVPSFHPITLPSQGTAPPQTVYTTPDDEIDFTSYLKEPLPAGVASSAGVKWKAHWLAVEGVQPAIAENPAPSGGAAGPGARGGKNAAQPASTTLKASAKAHLPQELQLYFTRLTSALVPPSPANCTPDSEAERHRLAALASLRGDVAVAGMLVYVVKWLGDSVQKCLMAPLGTVGHLVDAIGALLGNEGLFVEPYIHQLLPPLLSIILTVPLGPHPPVPTPNSPSANNIRERASDVLGKISSTYGKSYPGLLPRLVSTLIKALKSPPFPSPLGASQAPTGRYEGAVMGLAVLGKEAVREGIWGEGGEGLVRIDNIVTSCYPASESGKKKNPLMKSTIKALFQIIQPKPADTPTPPVNVAEVTELFGTNTAAGLNKKGWTASELIRMRREALAEGVREGSDGSAAVSGPPEVLNGTGEEQTDAVKEKDDDQMEVDTPQVQG
ncbi:transcription initiation factor TFIID subunit 6 [Cryptococcus wingfieldii CBS 7118]|uniref:Transcription initiation factor TFIID subunit 6 n=1 Tax=Cryptococcus wingfieldii CBS 7118 TaxID=1295528 RepID=A0A1E3HTQ5_9TREE|nr:transcription initiation factor TFIID subunit 6 [Cryptococcus wingfieldii CBS 7118]ODN79066.1 transcription initiation factor TFIID subunit 6 [Cryptococcus wingfieldii CBS 7118]